MRIKVCVISLRAKSPGNGGSVGTLTAAGANGGARNVPVRPNQRAPQ
jgi:hypothetical protein